MNGKPMIDASTYVAEGAVLSGNVAIGRNCGIWPNAVIRGDEEQIAIGNETSVQDNAVLHCGYGYPMTIGNHVTIGHGAIVHGCTIGDDTLIGMGAIILNGAKIGRGCIIGAGALVTEGTQIPDYSVAFGTPAKVMRRAREKDIEHNRKNADEYVALAKDYKDGKFKYYKK